MVNKSEDYFGPFQFFILILSVYVLIALFVQAVFKLPPEVIDILNTADNIVCGFFFIDFLVRFKQAENKLAFMKWGWIDLLSCIPMIDEFRYGRMVRVIRILKVLRAVRSTKTILSFLFKKKLEGTMAVVSSISVIVTIFGSVAILQVERGVPGSNIHSAGDAIWWAFVTITTVGYGDFFPVTIEGRFIAVMLMASGVGLFGTFTGLIASWLLEEDEQEQTKAIVNTLKDEVTELRGEIQELKTLLQQSKGDG